MKRRQPDWLGHIEFEERRKEFERRRQARNRAEKIARGGKTKFEAMTPEERDQLRDEIVHAYDTVSALVAEMTTPEALAEAERMRDEFRTLCDDLSDAIRLVEGRLAREFPGVQACVPVTDAERGDESLVYFDGARLLWADPPMQNRWVPILRAGLRVRTALSQALPSLHSALAARRWTVGPALCNAQVPASCLCHGGTALRWTRPLWQLQGLPNPRNTKDRSSVPDAEIHE